VRVVAYRDPTPPPASSVAVPLADADPARLAALYA
jgi:hypothetical protein